jgi:trk system potassium uptake protein TrkA
MGGTHRWKKGWLSMKIIIIGAGEVGLHLAKRLLLEKHDLVMVDTDGERCSFVQEALDVSVVQGSGSSQSVLREAELASADMLIAASGVDEVNVIACMVANKLGVKRKIARVRNRDYYSESALLSARDLGVDLFIHPEDEVIEEIFWLLMRGAASEIFDFENGKVLIVGLKLDAACPYIDRPLKEIGHEEERKHFRVVAILRGDKTIIPVGDDLIHKNDQIFVCSKRESLPQVLVMTGKSEQKLERILILGGGRIGRGVAKKLEDRKLKATLVESNKEKSIRVAEELNKTMVVHADGLDVDTLVREGLMEMDAFVATTSDDENNIIACLLAKHLKVQKTIAIVNKTTYLPLMPIIGIDSTVNVRLATATAILRFMRRGEIISSAAFHGLEAEAIEVEIKTGGKVLGKPLRRLHLPEGILIAAIIRGKDVVIPYGDSTIQKEDKVIIFALPSAISMIEKWFN